MSHLDHELLLKTLNDTDDDIRSLRSEIQDLRKDIADLYMFKWKLTGSISIISFIITLGINIFFKQGG